MKNRAVIALGSNIRPEIHIPSAILRLQRRTQIIAKSEFVSTKPVGTADQPEFINGVLLVETDLDRPELVKWLRDVEDELGRNREKELLDNVFLLAKKDSLFVAEVENT